MEPDNRMDKFAVCVEINEKIVGHLKKGTSGRFPKTIFYFLHRDVYSSAWGKVTGKRCNLGDGEGIQVPCKLNLNMTQFIGNEKINNIFDISKFIY